MSSLNGLLTQSVLKFVSNIIIIITHWLIHSYELAHWFVDQMCTQICGQILALSVPQGDVEIPPPPPRNGAQ